MNAAIRFAFRVIAADGWNPPWLIDISSGWCLHDALLDARDFNAYARAINVLSRAVGEDVMLWEREPGRTEEDIIELLEKVLA